MILQISTAISEVRVYCSYVDYFICQGIQIVPMLQIDRIQSCLNTIKQIVNQLCLATNEDTLVQNIEVIFIKSKTHQKTFSNKGKQVFVVSIPLFLGIDLNQSISQRCHVLPKNLPAPPDSAALRCFQISAVNFCFGFFWRYHAPHLIEDIHDEWHGVHSP